MIGVDTNVLVRYFVSDDPVQFRKADDFITQMKNRGVRLYVDDVVVCELVWVLRSAYKLDRETIAAILDDMLERGQFSFVDDKVIEAALDDYIAGSGDFADYVIGRLNQRAECETTFTFDRALQGELTFSVL